MKIILFIFLFLSATLLGKGNVYEKYAEDLPKLQEQEDWTSLIQLGEKTLSNGSGSLEQKAYVHADLANAYFYLGDYATGEIHAYECLKLSKELKNTESLIQSLYLLSAHKRGIGNTEDAWAFIEAQDLIEKALHLINKETLAQLKGTVYFNAGAAYADDPSGNLDLAVIYYNKAIAFFQESKSQDYYLRTLIRLSKALFLQGDIESSKRNIDAIDEDNCSKRTLMHLLYLKAQISIEEKENEKAKRYIYQGLAIANQQSLRIDYERLLSLLSEIE